MTLITALKGKGGLIAASDSRIVFRDNTYEDKSDKVFIINRNAIVLLAGDIDYIYPIILAFQKQNRQYSFGATETAKKLAEVVLKRLSDWTTQPVSRNPLVEQITKQKDPIFCIVTVGFDEVSENVKVPKIYTFSLQNQGPVEVFEDYYCEGEKTLADYLLAKSFKKNMDLNELCKLSATVISETASRYYGVGGPIHICQVTSSSSPHKLSSQEIRKLVGKVVILFRGKGE